MMSKGLGIASFLVLKDGIMSWAGLKELGLLAIFCFIIMFEMAH